MGMRGWLSNYGCEWTLITWSSGALLERGCDCSQRPGQINSALYFSRSVENSRGLGVGRQSWLLRYLETSLKNDFICCKEKKSFIIELNTSWRLSWQNCALLLLVSAGKKFQKKRMAFLQYMQWAVIPCLSMYILTNSIASFICGKRNIALYSIV